MPSEADDVIYLLVLQKPGEKFLSRLENEKSAKANYLPFLYRDGAPVQITATASDILSSAKITGDPDANKEVAALSKVVVSLHQKYLSAGESSSEEKLLTLEDNKVAFRTELMQTVQNTDPVYVHALALRWASPSGDYERMPDAIKQSCSTLQDSSPNHPWTAQLCALTRQLPPTIGDPFPDVYLPMMDSNSVQIKTLSAKKLTLIDLWASWCAPCRKENKDILSSTEDRFHDKGFTIDGYELETQKKSFKTMIQKDGADRWQHASHLQDDHSPLFETLKITTIPANYFLDQKGVIAAKNMHGGFGELRESM